MLRSRLGRGSPGTTYIRLPTLSHLARQGPWSEEAPGLRSLRILHQVTHRALAFRSRADSGLVESWLFSPLVLRRVRQIQRGVGRALVTGQSVVMTILDGIDGAPYRPLLAVCQWGPAMRVSAAPSHPLPRVRVSGATLPLWPPADLPFAPGPRCRVSVALWSAWFLCGDLMHERRCAHPASSGLAQWPPPLGRLPGPLHLPLCSHHSLFCSFWKSLFLFSLI